MSEEKKFEQHIQAFEVINMQDILLYTIYGSYYTSSICLITICQFKIKHNFLRRRVIYFTA